MTTRDFVEPLSCIACVFACLICLPAAAQNPDSAATAASSEPRSRKPAPSDGSGEKATPVVEEGTESSSAAAAGSAAERPTPAPAAPSLGPPLAPSPAASGSPVCLAGVGIDDDSGETAVTLVCDELRRQGVGVANASSAEGASEAYRVNMRRLGTVTYLELVHEKPVGRGVASRRIRLAHVEEASWGAPRLAEALVQGIPVEATARSDTLVGGETRSPTKRNTDTRFSLGAVGAVVGDQPGYGIDMALGFAGEDYGAHLVGRAAGGDASQVGLVLSAWRYLGDWEMAPLLGIGAGVEALSYDDGSGDGRFTAGGLVVEPTVGLEMFRFDKPRVQLFLSVGIPLFKLKRPSGSDSVYALAGTLSLAYLF